jgi:hypothetical protein
MAGFVASGATFTFCGVQATVTRVSVEAPTAEIVDMTAHNSPAYQIVLVPTGVYTGGTIDIDYIASAGGTDPATAIGKVGQAVFSGIGYGVAKQVVCESATKEAAVGQLVTGSMRFRITDHYVTDSLTGTGF